MVTRAALDMRVSKLVFPVYRNIIALAFLLPLAYFLEKKDRPPITLSFLTHFFLLALCGYLRPSSSRLLVNGATATHHTEFRPRAHLPHRRRATDGKGADRSNHRRDGVAKVLGTLACVSGASVITLFKGPAIYVPVSRAPPLHAVGKNWTLGCIYMVCNCLAWSGWLVLQAPVINKYPGPARLSFTCYTLFFGVLQFLAIAAFMERDAHAWVFHSGAELLTVLYAALVASGIAFVVQLWCIDRSGPVFVAVYQPVQTLVVAIMASIAFGDEIYLGGIIGAVLIIFGLYLVMWGKNQEQSFPDELPVLHSGEKDVRSTLNQPLIASYASEII